MCVNISRSLSQLGALERCYERVVDHNLELLYFVIIIIIKTPSKTVICLFTDMLLYQLEVKLFNISIWKNSLLQIKANSKYLRHNINMKLNVIKYI